MPLDEGTAAGAAVAAVPSGGYQLRESPVGFRSEFHCTLTPQWVFILSGQMEIGLQDGSTRRFGPGEHFYSADTLPAGATFDAVGARPLEPPGRRRAAGDLVRARLTTMGAHRLTEQAVGRYRTQGYLVPEWRLSEPRVQRLRAALERLLRNNPGVRPEKLVSAHLSGHGGAANAEGVHGDDEFMLLARDPQILDMVEALIGPDIVLWGCHVFCKPAGDGHETPWHQDGHYWPIRPLANCTVWVALDESTRRQRLPARHSRFAGGAGDAPASAGGPRRRGAATSAWPITPSTKARRWTSNCSPARCRCTTCS